MKLHLLSDTHNREFLPQGDACIHAGDLSHRGINKNYVIPSKTPLYWIPGNHDIGANKWSALCPNTYNVLERQNLVGDKFTIKGVSLTPCHDLPILKLLWDHMVSDESEEKQYYENHLNQYYDIIVSHSPPYGDISTEKTCGTIGSKPLLEYIEKFQPLLVVTGHVHNPLTRVINVGQTRVVNVATTEMFIEL